MPVKETPKLEETKERPPLNREPYQQLLKKFLAGVEEIEVVQGNANTQNFGPTIEILDRLSSLARSVEEDWSKFFSPHSTASWGAFLSAKDFLASYRDEMERASRFWSGQMSPEASFLYQGHYEYYMGCRRTARFWLWAFSQAAYQASLCDDHPGTIVYPKCIGCDAKGSRTCFRCSGTLACNFCRSGYLFDPRTRTFSWECPECKASGICPLCVGEGKLTCLLCKGSARWPSK